MVLEIFDLPFAVLSVVYMFSAVQQHPLLIIYDIITSPWTQQRLMKTCKNPKCEDEPKLVDACLKTLLTFITVTWAYMVNPCWEFCSKKALFPLPVLFYADLNAQNPRLICLEAYNPIFLIICFSLSPSPSPPRGFKEGNHWGMLDFILIHSPWKHESLSVVTMTKEFTVFFMFYLCVWLNDPKYPILITHLLIILLAGLLNHVNLQNIDAMYCDGIL